MTSLNRTSHSNPSDESEPRNLSSDDSGAQIQQLIHVDPSQPIPTSTKARAKQHIAALEEELETLRKDRGTKLRKTTYYIAQGRAIRHMVVLYTSLEDLISKNDHRYESMRLTDEATTPEQDNLQAGYLELTQTLPWLHGKLGEFDHEECEGMLKKLKKGADVARGDDTSSLKDLVAGWVNQDDACGKLLALPNGTGIKHGFQGHLTSPSSAKEIDGDGDGADILENNRRAWQKSDQSKVKTCVASIINMRKVTPRAIAYIMCQVRFALSGVSSWRTVDGDFDYEIFWTNIVAFFEVVPGPVTRCRVDKLLEWWTRKVFGTNHRQDLTPDVVSQMSVNSLAEQRRMLEDAAFDSE
ncbi:hypothetical protein DFH29DRAFT_877484 [Suillus ampliporus]|nr:hypothetical protein DFH29DRAFT_877484 [Suillus ampliporus]